MDSLPMSVRSDSVSLTGPAKAGVPTPAARVLHAEGYCATWRTLLVSATGPVDLDLGWTVATTQFRAQVTMANGGAVCLFAKTLFVDAVARAPGEHTVSAGIYEGRTDTHNVWVADVVGDAGGARVQVAIPPFAQTVTLDPGSGTASAELSLIDAYAKARLQRAGAPGEPIRAVLGSTEGVFVHLPPDVTGRLTYSLPF